MRKSLFKRIVLFPFTLAKGVVLLVLGLIIFFSINAFIFWYFLAMPE